MKKLIIVLSALTLLGATAYAQTQKTNRTKTKSHDRSEMIQGDTSSKNAQTEKAGQQTDMDRNNPDKNTTPKPAKANTPK